MDVTAFRWGVGIEDTFIGQPHPRTGRVLDEYELIDHYRRWRADLDLVAGLGIDTMRYGIPWYRVEPRPCRFDWRWTDAVLEYLVSRLGITPIIDLMHYGTPVWLEGSFSSPDYPARVAAYASAFAERYRSLISWYTPLNEPVVNAVFCGHNAVWPPYLRGERGYVRLLVALAAGMSETIRAVRAAQPEAIIVHVESADWQSTDDPTLEPRVAWTRTAHALPAELVMGQVDAPHAAWGWLLEHEASLEVLEKLRTDRQRIDVMGVNFYPNLSRSTLDAPTGMVRHRRRYATGADLTDLLTSVHDRFGLPLMITETSVKGTVGRRSRWMDASLEAVRTARGGGVPVIGYTWWPAFSLVGWNWRGGRRDLDAYWCHMGLWDIPQAATLERVATPLVEQYRDHVAAGQSRIGSVGERAA